MKWLLIVQGVLFLLFFFASVFRVDHFFWNFALVPAAVVDTFSVWQLFTYAFLHRDPLHFIFNALSLWMFGNTMERTWGTKRFLQFYFFCGMVAGVFGVIGGYLFKDPITPTIGASGAIFGLLVAFGVVFADQTIFFSFVFPMKAKYMVMIVGALQFLMSFTPSRTAYIVHLGGMIAGGAYMLLFRGMPRFDLSRDLKRRYREWKIQRAKKKFEVYLKKHNAGRGPWTN